MINWFVFGLNANVAFNGTFVSAPLPSKPTVRGSSMAEKREKTEGERLTGSVKLIEAYPKGAPQSVPLTGNVSGLPFLSSATCKGDEPGPAGGLMIENEL